MIHGIARDRIVVYSLSSPSYEGRRWVDVFAIALDRTSVSDAAELTRNMDGASLSPWVGIAPDGTISTMWRTIEIDQPSILPQLQILPQDFAADWDKVRIVPAPIIERIYRNPVSSDAMTMPGGTACAAYYKSIAGFRSPGAARSHGKYRAQRRPAGRRTAQATEYRGEHRRLRSSARDLDIAVIKQGEPRRCLSCTNGAPERIALASPLSDGVELSGGT